MTLGLVTLVLLSQAPAPEAKPTPPAPPPEIKKTTDAFAGKWSMDAELTMPGATEPTKFKVTMDCKSIALGNGAHCAMDGKVPKMGPMGQSCLVGFDPVGGAVHLMCITSMGEVHDHKGAWKDDKTLEFEPYKFTMDGKAATEMVLFSWVEPKLLTFTSIVTLADGSRMTFAGRGKRK